MVLLHPFQGKHSHAHVPYDNRHALLDVRHRNAAGFFGLRIDRDAAVHFLQRDALPLVVDPHFCSLVGSAVEALGERPIDVGFRQSAITAGSGRGAMIGDLSQDLLERLGRQPHRLQSRRSWGPCGRGRW